MLTAMAAAALPRVSSNCCRVSTRVAAPSRIDTSSPPMANRTEICAPSPRRLTSSVLETSGTDQVSLMVPVTTLWFVASLIGMDW